VFLRALKILYQIVINKWFTPALVGKLEFFFYFYESAPKSQKPLNPLKGTLKSSLIFNDIPFRGRGKEVENQ
jgi:hypothetical protein